MNNNMDISVIISVYNVEKYIVRCLDSIFNQQFSGTFEVIAVDDASTDNSLEILYNYQKKENRLHIIAFDINQKQTKARLAGLVASTGNYIMNVDSDDWLLPGALTFLYSKITETEADVVVFNYARENSEGEFRCVKKIKKQLVSTDKAKVQKHFYGAVVNKIVKRTLVENMIGGEVSPYCTEDLLFCTEILFRAEKICLVPETYYIYFENSDSLTYNTGSEKYIQTQIIILRQLQKIIFKYNPKSILIRNLLNYYEKWIYLEMAKIHFWNKGKKIDSNMFLREISHLPIMTRSRIRRIELSLKSGIICLFEVTCFSGFRRAVGIVLRSFRK